MKINTNDTLHDAIEFYGNENQLHVAVEEMAELQKELMKRFRGAHNTEEIAEEIADVEIMMEQLKIIFGIGIRTEKYKEYKMQRLKERIENAKHTVRSE